MFKIRILGSGAGGGLPQWNCGCNNCNNCRNGKLLERTQSSIAVTINDKDWVILNSSPDFRRQFNKLIEKYPIDNIRNTNIKDVILADSQIDHVTGLLSMRETRELNLYSTTNIKNELTNDFNILEILKHYCKINFREINNPEYFTIESIPELEFCFVFLKGKPPPYSKNRLHQQSGDNLGILIKHKISTKYVFYAPGIEEINQEILDLIKNSELTLIDGTVWTATELIDLKISSKNSYEMGHIPVSISSKIFIENNLKNIHLIHINNTNPILNKLNNEYKYLKNNNINITQDDQEFII